MKRTAFGLAALVGLCSWLVSGMGGMPASVSAAPKSAAAKDSTKTAGQRASARTPLQSLVAAEKAFAALSESRGMRTAFLANLAQESVVFHPLPVNGLKHWTERTEAKGRLLWEPSYAEIAGSGDFGITTGPWEFRPPAGEDGGKTGYGQFFSVWTRDGRSPWKVVLDIGINHPKPAKGLGESEISFGPEHSATSADAAGSLMLITVERSLTRMVAGVGANALHTWISPDARYLRDGMFPQLGKSARDSLAASISRTAWRPTGSSIARSGDLGYTYGIREDSTGVSWQTPDSAAYVHVWRRTGDAWKLAAIVESPFKRGQR